MAKNQLVSDNFQLMKENAQLRSENDQLKRENEKVWRDFNHLKTKFQAWERIMFVRELPITTMMVRQWGPGEGDEVKVAMPSPQRLGEIMDEIINLRKKVKNGS